jgi:hypothetical protein
MSRVKERAKALIDELPDEVVSDLMGFVQRLQEWEATREILDDPEMGKAIEEGKAAIAEGATVRWRDVKRKV